MCFMIILYTAIVTGSNIYMYRRNFEMSSGAAKLNTRHIHNHAHVHAAELSPCSAGSIIMHLGNRVLRME